MNRHQTVPRLLLMCALLFPAALLPRTTSARQAAGAQPTLTRRQLAGLKQSVTVRRDARGIPYVEAANEEDLYFAQGYVTASDRLWQMELMRRTARGELSEILGRAALEEDKRRRSYGFAHVVERQLARSTPETRASLEAYARGVNAHLAALDEKTLPLEFQILGFRPRPWTPADSALVGKNFAEALSTTWHIDLARAAFAAVPADKREALFPVVSPIDVLVVCTDTPARPRASVNTRPEFSDPGEAAEALRALSADYAATRRSLARIGLDAEDLAASNNFVVGGRRTVTGKPLLANDPHLAPSAPPIWYMVHLSAPGLRVAGVTAPGAPGVIIGHNERIAWGATNLAPDVQDLYAETFNPEQPRSYKTPDGWREAEVRREVIRVRKGPADPSTEEVAHEVLVTRNGPVVFERAGRRFALRWTALDPSSAADFDGFYHLNRARHWKGFTAALSRYGGPTQNFIYADSDNHIGYYGAGLVPVRRKGTGDVPFDGSTDDGQWAGHIPFAELPHVFDPPSGVIVTANSRVAGTSYPHHLTNFWSPPTRARRILDLVNAKPRLSHDDFAAIMGDAYTISGHAFARAVAETARKAGLAEKDAKWRESVALLSAWDGQLTPDSRAARLAAEMRSVFQQKILTAAVGAELAREYRWANSATFFDRLASEQPREWLPQGVGGYAELFDAAHTEARAALAKRLGEDETRWTWGREAVVRFPHPLASAPEVGKMFAVEPFPQRGGGGTFAAPNVGAGVSMRLIADPSNWDATRQGISLGESGDPRSPHWRDQLEDWRSSTPRAFPFTPSAVRAAARSTLTLEPRAK